MSDDQKTQPFGSRDLAELIVDALIDAGVVGRADLPRAVEIAAEEVEVRVALGNVELK